MSGKLEKRMRRNVISLQAKREEKQFARIVAGQMQKIVEKRALRARRNEVIKDTLIVGVAVAMLCAITVLIAVLA